MNIIIIMTLFFSKIMQLFLIIYYKTLNIMLNDIFMEKYEIFYK